MADDLLSGLPFLSSFLLAPLLVILAVLGVITLIRLNRYLRIRTKEIESRMH